MVIINISEIRHAVGESAMHDVRWVEQRDDGARHCRAVSLYGGQYDSEESSAEER